MDGAWIRRKVKRMLGVVLFSVGAGYLVVVGAVFALQRRVVFPAPAPRAVPAIPGAVPIVVPDEAGPVHALYMAPPDGAPTVVFFHGNGEQLADLGPFLVDLHRQGLGVVAMEYPGYGPSHAQSASESSIDAAAETLLKWLEANKGLDEKHLVLAGHSLGTGVATEMAARGHGARLVLLAPYTSIAAVGARYFWWLPTRLLTLDRFDTADKAPHIAIPVLIVHGKRDHVIPWRMGRRLAGLFPHARLDLRPRASHDLLDELPDLAHEIAVFTRGEAPGTRE